MRTSIYILAAAVVAGFATASAQNTGNMAPSRMQTPAQQPTNPPPAAQPMPSPRTPTPARPGQPTQSMPASPNTPPDSRMHPSDSANNPQQRVPPASRDVGKQGRPDCSK